MNPDLRAVTLRPFRALLLALMGLACVPLAAQRPDRAGQRPNIAKVYGRALDGSTRKGVEFATVSLLLAEKDSVVSGALTEPNGDFVMDKLPTGRFRLRISSLGYANAEQQVTITMDKPEQDLGNIVVQPTAQDLGTATVVAERAQAQLLVDRRVYNVDKDLNVRGGTGVDVMKNVPGLTVDADENVQLRNGSPQIMVDGRPSALTLEQIPADDIERVEVITNPGVAFDASSSGGIINVVLKKSTKPGYNGQVQANAGTNGRYGGNLSLNVKDGRWQWNLSGNMNLNDNTTRTRTLRDSYTEGVLSDAFRQSGNSRNRRIHYGGRAGAEVQITNRSSMSLGANIRGRGYDSEDDLDWTERDAAAVLTGQGDQRNDGHNEGNDMGFQAGFKHKTPVEGREWTTDLTYNRNRRESTTQFLTNARDGDGTIPLGGTRTQTSNGDTKGDQLTWQFDMSDPRNEKSKLEYGLRSNLRFERSILNVDIATDTSAAQRDASLSNDYDIRDMVNAAYVNWIRKLNAHWGLQAGMRLEQTSFEASIRDPGASGAPRQRFTYLYPDGLDDLAKALFPALYFSRKWEGTRELQFNFSRKISRPNFFQVMPFIMFSDTRNVRLGNPALAPEFINLAEVNHLMPFKKNPRQNWLTSLFVRQTENVITGFSTPSTTDPDVLVNSWINGDNSITYGWENTVKLEPWKGAQFTVGGTVQYVEIGAGSIRNNGWMMNAKANLNMRLPKDWSVQVNGEYEGRRPQPQGYAIPNGGVDLSASKDIGKHWTVQATVNDVFYTRLWGTILDTPALYQETERRREMRFARLSVTWKFGEQDASLFRRRDKGTNQRRDPGAAGSEGEM